MIAEWEQAAEREKRSRTLFAQEGIKVDEVAGELEKVRGSHRRGLRRAPLRDRRRDRSTGATVIAIARQVIVVDLAERRHRRYATPWA